MQPPPITQIFPTPARVLTPHDLIAAYTIPRTTGSVIRVNMVSSLDGSATINGTSRPLSSPADTRVLGILRRLADVILVGAGTVRAEKYGSMRLGAEAVAWRTNNGLAPQPGVAVVSNRLELDPQSDLFATAPVRPIVFTTDGSPPNRRRVLAEVADVVTCGAESVDLAHVADALRARNFAQVLCEGGPQLFDALIISDLVDELCLTLSPVLAGGAGVRTVRGDSPIVPQHMTLTHILESDKLLLTRYSRRQHARNIRG